MEKQQLSHVIIVASEAGTPPLTLLLQTPGINVFLWRTQKWAPELDSVNLLFLVDLMVQSYFFPLTVDLDIHVYTQWQRGQSGKFCPILSLSGNWDGNRKSLTRIECRCLWNCSSGKWGAWERRLGNQVEDQLGILCGNVPVNGDLVRSRV